MAGFIIPVYSSQTQNMVVFAEEFTGDTFDTTFQLTGNPYQLCWRKYG